MMADLKGKAGIVTGGSSGIGFQIANVLAEAGATVYVTQRGRGRKRIGRCPPEGRCGRCRSHEGYGGRACRKAQWLP